MKRLSLNVPISKLDEEQHMVYGYASTPQLDSQGDRITVAALEKALPGYMQFANIREMHQPITVGKTKTATVDDGGLYIGAKIVDEPAWTKVKEGVYSAFSIGGFINTKKGADITDMDLVEISLVDRPANPGATIDIWKSARPQLNQFWWATRLPIGTTISLTNLSSAMKKNEEVKDEPVVETPVVETPTDVPTEHKVEEPKVETPAEPVVETPAETPAEPVAEEETPAEKAAQAIAILQGIAQPNSEKKEVDLTKIVEVAVAKAIAPLAQEVAELKGQATEKVEIKAKASYVTIEKGSDTPSPAQEKLDALMNRHAELLELRKSLKPEEYSRRYSTEAQTLVSDITALKASL